MPDGHSGGQQPKIAPGEYPLLHALVAERPDRTVQQLCHAWTCSYGVQLSRFAMLRALQKAGLTWKNNGSGRPEQLRPVVQEQRKRFMRWMKRIDPARLVFIDESGCNTGMAASNGWCDKGRRLVAHKPANWGHNISNVGAIRDDRVLCHSFFDGSVNTDKFLHFVEKVLCPRLRPRDVVILDNLRPHKDPRVFAAVARVGARVRLLPSYSPDLNPIELLWSSVKRSLRAVAQRTADGVKQVVRSALRHVPTQHCSSWFRHCGHRAQGKRSLV
jgi:transposase